VAIADMITITFLFILEPGEFTGTTSDYTSFRLQDLALYNELHLEGHNIECNKHVISKAIRYP
jgi:hypothetical protein